MSTPVAASMAGTVIALVFAGSLSVVLWMLGAARAYMGLARTRGLRGRARVILAPVTSAPDSQRRVDLAARLAAENGALLLLAYVLEVPWTLPLDATLERADEEARAALEAARLTAERHHVPVRQIVRRAREAREGIAAAARYHHADLVFRDSAPRARRWHLGAGRPVVR